MGSLMVIVGYMMIGTAIGHSLYNMIKKTKGVC